MTYNTDTRHRLGPPETHRMVFRGGLFIELGVTTILLTFWAIFGLNLTLVQDSLCSRFIMVQDSFFSRFIMVQDTIF